MEYLKALKQRKNALQKGKDMQVSVSHIVLV